jgi:succinate dehydrogenase hydrophobic anchor subunit
MATSASRVAPSRRPVAGGRARLIWRLTAGSGVALLLLITVHMIANHFVVESVGGLRSYEQVLDYIANPVMLAIEIAFLGVVTLHAMLGLRSVLFDLTGSDRHRRWIDRGLVALGIVTVAYGLVLVLTLASRA